MPNQFLMSRKNFIEQLRNQLMEYHYAGSYGGNLPLVQINNLLGEMSGEITRLQDQVENLQDKVRKAKEGFMKMVETQAGEEQDEDSV
jgi:uncharacterized coiled-coil protein SlyX